MDLCLCAVKVDTQCSIKPHCHGPLSKRRGSEKKAYLGEMKAWLGSVVDICTSMCAYNMYYSGKLS